MKPRLLLLFGLFLTACSTTPESETRPAGEPVLSAAAIRAAKSAPVDFVTQVRPILEQRCAMCHNRRILKGHMSLESRREAVRSGALGAYIVPGYPEHSLLVTNVESHHRMSVMPVVGTRLTADEVLILSKWIREGAAWPAGAAGTLEIGL
jgi:uncharacterized membrane protein